MTRSRRRKIAREEAKRFSRALLKSAPFASAMLVAWPSAHAQDNGSLEEVVVTAQKREENLQKVPVSITAIGTERLDQLQVTDFADYAKFLPSVAFQSLGPGQSAVYMRGIASGENSNHSGPLPSVGIYLDEQPITTITGALDLHIYDIARVEAIEGPQGTLYGASSQAGAIRIITNKPDPSAFKSSYALEGNMVESGGTGYLAEGMVNIPLSERAAIRLVGWKERDAGYIDNVAGTRTYPSFGTINNDGLAKKDFNDVDTYGARAALQVDLNDNWTVTPILMGQNQESDGFFGDDPTVGKRRVQHYRPDYQKDKWGQAALTVEGKFSNFDLVYAGAYLKRDIDSSADYSDYTFFYDVNYFYGALSDDNGNPIDPTQYFLGRDRFTKSSNELRLSWDPLEQLHVVFGGFTQRQKHKIHQRYKIDNLASAVSVTGWDDTLWLTQQTRIDRDDAFFADVTYKFTDKLSVITGVRKFWADNTLVGFFGYGLGYSSSGSGEAQCDVDSSKWVPYKGAPCTNLDKGIKEDGWTPRFSVNYNFTESAMAYVTYSKGFRPGGINRRGTLPPYNADFIKNYEVGWKTSWANNTLRFNGALYRMDWDDIQFSYLGQSGLTEIKNANDARVKGAEASIEWAVTSGFLLTGGLNYVDAKLIQNYCGTVDPISGTPITDCTDPLAPKGTRLPAVPELKGSLTGRYTFPVRTFEAHVQASVVHQGNAYSDLTQGDRALVGRQPGYTVTDLSTGLEWGNSTLELYVHNAFDERAEDFRTTQCAVIGFDGNPACGLEPYSLAKAPRTVGLRFGQSFK
jgi:outer membrane receptor protein involved in Fe transport